MIIYVNLREFDFKFYKLNYDINRPMYMHSNCV